MLITALTGGIGSGKTTVSNLFAEHGVPIIDTDVIAHELVASGQPALDEIRSKFGTTILNADGTLNRKKLRQQIFSELDKRKLLENILHPRIYEEAKKRLSNIDVPYCIVVIPLLTGINYRGLIDRVLVIDVPEEVQIKRAMARDNCSEEEARAIIETQTKQSIRLSIADDILQNTCNLINLKQKVLDLHKYYSNMSSSTKV